MSANPSQLLLLADHIKLSLLERQRAISLNLQPNSRDGEISRSLDALRDGIEKLENSSAITVDIQQTARLRQQYNDLHAQFTGTSPGTTSSTLTKPNDSSLASDFTSAQRVPARKPSASSLKKQASDRNFNNKSVRFSDNPFSDDEGGSGSGSVSPVKDPSSAATDANRASLFPYKDDPDDDPAPDHTQLDNQQIHEYHSQVLRDQDAALDRLGESIGRQREISLRIGDELDEQMEMLDDVDEGVDRHQTQLDKAKKRLGGVARKAKDNWSITTIVVLILILVLLIVVLK